MNTALPLLSGLLSVVFTGLLLARFAARGGAHHLIWSLGMLLYAVGGLCEAYNSALGWSALPFRLWYICGAFLAAAWLGQGTIALLWRRAWWVTALTILLAACSVFAAVKVLTVTLDPSMAVPGAPLTGRVITGGGVRGLTPFFNSYGTLALVGGAIWSAISFARRRVLANRVVGNAFIAVGALMPAIGGALAHLGVESLLYGSELLGAVLLFIGFLVSTRRSPEELAASVPASRK